jgi:hypothetical protein
VCEEQNICASSRALAVEAGPFLAAASLSGGQGLAREVPRLCSHFSGVGTNN